MYRDSTEIIRRNPEKMCTNMTDSDSESMDQIVELHRTLRINHDSHYVTIPKETVKQIGAAVGDVIIIKVCKGQPPEGF